MTPNQSQARLLLKCMACLAFAMMAPGSVWAQYFGQNKVQYEKLDFKVLKTDHFDLHFYDEEATAARDVARMAERWYARLSRILGHELTSRQPIILYASNSAFRATTVIPGDLGEGTGGVTEGLRRRVVLPVSGSIAETDHVLGHELVHAFQYDMTRTSEGPAVANLPLWFVEGMAEYLSIGPVDSMTAMWMRDAIRRGDFPTVSKLDNFKYFPYRYGQAFWAYVGGKYGDGVIARLLRDAATDDLKRAIQRVLNVSDETLSADWRSSLEDRYEPILRATSDSANEGRVLIAASKSKGELNVSPVLSPDGSRMVLFSERDTLSIDLFLADARTGSIQRKITESVIDPHLDSLQFIASAGAWSSDGVRFAFGSIREGRPEVSIYDVSLGDVGRRIPLPGMAEVFHLTWSPDGRSIAMSALSGGQTDLFILDLDKESVRRLTNDSFAELQPAWSPDGRRIAFVTDRFTSQLASLSFGSYRLGLVDVNTSAILPVAAFGNGKQINPQWSDDGSALFFISDRDGVSNIYRVSTRDNTVRQVTRVSSGVSGITALSPALSVATRAKRLVYSVFDGGNFSIQTLDSAEALGGEPISRSLEGSNAGVLPPRNSASGEMASLLADSRLGLDSLEGTKTENYDPSLSLDYIAPVDVAVGMGNFGTLIGGGTTLSWSDLLGYHNFSTTIQSSMTTEGGHFLNNVAAVAGYTNQRSRWNWGIGGGQVPFVSGDFSRVLAPAQGVVVDRSVQVWQINREIGGLAAYPFNRAQRLEFSAGYQNISFDAEERAEVYDFFTGELLSEQRQDLPSFDSLRLGNAGTALVYDTSVFAGTSPVTGQRYRLEFGATAGSLKFANVLADYRRYHRVARSLVLAGRLLHVGRYRGDSEDGRLQDMFVGQESLVRGYSPGSFSPSECNTGGSAQTCPVFDQLLGSRIGVANAEVRVPLFGALGLVRSPGAPPVETALFYDAGVAWTRAQSPGFSNGPRSAVTSHGASLRINLLGFAIAQISYVHPNSRPDQRWRWEFALVPGF